MKGGYAPFRLALPPPGSTCADDSELRAPELVRWRTRFGADADAPPDAGSDCGRLVGGTRTLLGLLSPREERGRALLDHQLSSGAGLAESPM